MNKGCKTSFETSRRTECKHCEHCDLGTNKCLRDGKKCYEKGMCLHLDCLDYEQGRFGVYD